MTTPHSIVVPATGTPALDVATTPALDLAPAILQLGEFSAFQWGLLGVEVVTVLLGFAIAYVAVQGYRRNDSRPMLFVAVGFVLLVGVPAVLSAVYLGTDLIPQAVLAVVGSVGEVAGMASILYGLRGPTSK